MEIKKCTVDNVEQLALLNKQLIEDEKSDNTMSIDELEKRMKEFLLTEYNAYFFYFEDLVIGYALVNHTTSPYYLRQFLIDRKYRKQHFGLQAFELLMEELKTDSIDLEVLTWNEVGNRFWEKCGFVERSRYMRLKNQA